MNGLSPLLPIDNSPAYEASSPEYRVSSPTPTECEDSESEASPTLLDIAAAQSEGCPGHPAAVFMLELVDVDLDSLWHFITQQIPSRKWLENATRLMASLNDCNRPHLCKIILEWTDRLPGLLENPTRAQLEEALIIIDLCKFASERWLAIPKRRRTE